MCFLEKEKIQNLENCVEFHFEPESFFYNCHEHEHEDRDNYPDLLFTTFSLLP